MPDIAEFLPRLDFAKYLFVFLWPYFADLVIWHLFGQLHQIADGVANCPRWRQGLVLPVQISKKTPLAQRFRQPELSVACLRLVCRLWPGELAAQLFHTPTKKTRLRCWGTPKASESRVQ